MPVSCKTFLLNIFCRLNPQVDSNALTIPNMSKEISDTVATATPRMMGTKDQYTWEVCLSFMMNLLSKTVKSGIDALTVKKQTLF